MSDVDLLTVGRVNLDLYAQQVGIPFEDVVGFDAMVGGSPVNVALAAARLGVRAGVFTAVGDDLVGDWVVRMLKRDGVDTSFASRKSGPHTSLALLAQVPPDHPLVFYRHDPADVHLTVKEAAELPLGKVPAMLVSADALARGSTSQACTWILQSDRLGSTTVYFDLDLRPVNWRDLDTYAAVVSRAIEHTDVVLGTTEEFGALLGTEPDESVEEAIRLRLLPEARRALILKQGARGATFFVGGETIQVAARPVREASTVGAGDSFAAGLIHARLNGADWSEAGQLAAECAAITVSRFGCSRGFPSLNELNHQAVGVADGT